MRDDPGMRIRLLVFEAESSGEEVIARKSTQEMFIVTIFFCENTHQRKVFSAVILKGP